MQGSYKILLEKPGNSKRYKNLKYELVINSKISYICGDSGTGKTTITKLLLEHLTSGGVSCNVYRMKYKSENKYDEVKCDVKFLRFFNNDIEEQLSKSNNIYILDEDDYFLRVSVMNKSKLKSFLFNSDNYFIIITRDNLNIECSIDNIYEMQYDEKSNTNKLIKHYNLDINCNKNLEYAITEDSKLGYNLIKSIYLGTVVSSNGKSGVYNKIQEFINNGNNYGLVFVDGSAFSTKIAKIYPFAESKRIFLYAPNSLEFLILRYLFYTDNKDVCTHPWDYIDYNKFHTLEQYFTDVLINYTSENKNIRYTKNSVLPYYYDKVYLIFTEIKHKLDKSEETHFF